MPEFAQHAEAFLQQKLALSLVIAFLTRLGNRPPERQLGRHIDAKHVCCGKGGIRRAGCMIAIVIDAVAPDGGQQRQPCIEVSRCVTGARKQQPVRLAAQENRLPVDEQLTLLRAKVAQTEGHRVQIAVQVDGQHMDDRMKLVP